jgi:hypothetical protein
LGWLSLEKSSANNQKPSLAAATTISTKYYDRVGAKPLILIGISFIILATWAFCSLKVDSSKGFVMLWMTSR